MKGYSKVKLESVLRTGQGMLGEHGSEHARGNVAKLRQPVLVTGRASTTGLGDQFRVAGKPGRKQLLRRPNLKIGTPTQRWNYASGCPAKAQAGSPPRKAINIGNGPFPLDAADVYAAMMRGSKLLVLRSKTMLLHPGPK